MIRPSICRHWQNDRSDPAVRSPAATDSYTTPRDTIPAGIELVHLPADFDALETERSTGAMGRLYPRKIANTFETSAKPERRKDATLKMRAY